MDFLWQILTFSISLASWNGSGTHLQSILCCHVGNNLDAIIASTHTTGMLFWKPWNKKIYKPSKNAPITRVTKHKRDGRTTLPESYVCNVYMICLFVYTSIFSDDGVAMSTRVETLAATPKDRRCPGPTSTGEVWKKYFWTLGQSGNLTNIPKNSIGCIFISLAKKSWARMGCTSGWTNNTS